MRPVTLFFLLLFASVATSFGAPKVLEKADEESYAGKIVRISVGENDLMVGQSFKFWERTLKRAEDEGAKAVIFDLDTPGGLAFPTEELMSQIADLSMPTLAFVNPKALSAGSFIAISTDEIYMTPGSKIGSSAIVSGGGGEIDPVMRAKLESYFGAQIRYITKKKGHRAEVVEAMMFLSEEERQIGDVLVKPGELLNLNSEEATKIMDDGPLLAKAEVKDLDEIYSLKGWSEDEVMTAEPSTMESIAWWIGKWSGILIAIGFVAGYVELKAPGFGVGGVLSLTAFFIFFFGNYAAGNMAGYGMALVFVIGLILIALEIFVIPGFGVPGILGILAVVGSLLFSMTDVGDWHQYQWQGGFSLLLSKMSEAFTKIAIGIFGSLGLMYLLMKYLPQVELVNRNFLPTSLAPGDGKESLDGVAVGERVGMTGVALSDLRPTGNAELSGQVMEVISEGEFITKGDEIRVIAEDGMGLVVKKV